MKKFFLLYSFLLSIYLQSQAYEAEFLSLNCIYNRYKDNGLKLKHNFLDFEKLLIAENILPNATSKGYKAVLTKIATEPYFDYSPSRALITEELTAVMPESIKPQNCEEEIRKTKGTDFTKVDRLKRIFDSIVAKEDWGPADMAKGVLSVLDEEDYQHDYYKLEIFTIFNMINVAPLSDKIFPGLRESEELKNKINLTRALTVHLDDKNQILIKDKKVTKEELKRMVYNYEKEEKSEAVFVISQDGSSLFKYYLQLRDFITEEVMSLREQFAFEKFTIKLSALNTHQLEIVEEEYPVNIIVQ